MQLTHYMHQLKTVYCSKVCDTSYRGRVYHNPSCIYSLKCNEYDSHQSQQSAQGCLKIFGHQNCDYTKFQLHKKLLVNLRRYRSYVQFHFYCMTFCLNFVCSFEMLFSRLPYSALVFGSLIASSNKLDSVAQY